MRQTALFASYVAAAHSWYKHLPVHKKVPFLFFLDPNAGKYLARDAKGRETMRPIEDPKDHIHYTAQKTDDYLRRFGFWNYDAQYGTSLLYRVGDHTADTEPQGSRVVNNEGEWIPVSTDVIELGRAEVNAFVHPHASLRIWEMRLKGAPLQADPSTEFPRLEYCLKGLASDSRLALVPLPPSAQNLIDQQDCFGTSLWREENLFDELLNLVPENDRVKEELFPALLEHLESQKTRSELEWALKIIDDSASQSARTGLVEHFHRLLFPERLRQLRALNSALNRVVEFVYRSMESGSGQ
jgi:hypothetical protein